MIDDLEIPEEMASTFKRVMRRVPNELKGDTEFLRNLLIYVKIGGEKLARQRIEITKKPFREGYLLLNRLIPEETLQDLSGEASDDESDDKDESSADISDDTTDEAEIKDEEDNL